MLASPHLSGTGYPRASSGGGGGLSRRGERDLWRLPHLGAGSGPASHVREGPGNYPVASEQNLPAAQQRLPSVSRSRLMQYGSRVVSPIRGSSPRATPEAETLLRPPVGNIGTSVSPSASPPFPGARGSIGHPRGLFARVSYCEAPSSSPMAGAPVHWDPMHKNSGCIPGSMAQEPGTPEPHSVTRSARKRGRPLLQDIDGDEDECSLSGARPRPTPQVSLSRREAAKGWVLSTLSRIPLVGSLVSASQEHEADSIISSPSAAIEEGRNSCRSNVDGPVAPVQRSVSLARSQASPVLPYAGKYGDGKEVRDFALPSEGSHSAAASFFRMAGYHTGERNLGGSPRCVRTSFLFSSQGGEPPKDALIERATPMRGSFRSPANVNTGPQGGSVRFKAGYPRPSHGVLREGEPVDIAPDGMEEDEEGTPEVDATREGESPFFASPLDPPTQWRSPGRETHHATPNRVFRHQLTGLTHNQEQKQEHQRVLSSLPVYASADEWQKDLDYILCMRDKFQLPPVVSDLTTGSGPSSVRGRETVCPVAKRARRTISSGHRAASPSPSWDPLSAVATAMAGHYAPSGSEYRTRALHPTQTSQTGSARWGSSGAGTAEATGSSSQNPFALYNESQQRAIQERPFFTSDTAFYGSRNRRKHRALRATDYRRLLRQAKFHSCKWIDYFDYVKARTADVEDYHHFRATATHKRVATSLAEGGENADNRSSPHELASVTPARRGSLLIADLPPPPSARRSLALLDGQLQRKEDSHQRSSPVPPGATSASSEVSVGVSVDRRKSSAVQRSKADVPTQSDGGHPQAPNASPTALAPKSQKPSGKSDEAVPWWKANLGKPTQVTVEEDGFADNAQDEAASPPKPTNAFSTFTAGGLGAPTISGTGLFSGGLSRTESSEEGNNKFLFKPSLTETAETPFGNGHASGILSASPPDSAASERLSMVDASAANPKTSGSLSEASSSLPPVLFFGKSAPPSSETAPSPLLDNNKRSSLAVTSSTSNSIQKSGGSPPGKKRPSLPGSSSLFSAEPTVLRGSLFGDEGKARTSSTDQSSSISCLFGQSGTGSTSKDSSEVTEATNKASTVSSTCLFGSGSGHLAETKKATAVPPQTKSSSLFSSGSAGHQTASPILSSTLGSSLFTVGSSHPTGSKEATCLVSSTPAINGGAAQEQQKEPSSMPMQSSLFSTTSTSQPQGNTSSATAKAPFLFGNASLSPSSNAQNSKAQPAPAPSSIFAPPSSATENQLGGSMSNAPSAATAGVETATSDNRGLGLFGTTTLTPPKTSLFGTTTGSVFSAGGFGNATKSQRTGLTDPGTTGATPRQSSSVGIPESNGLPSESSFSGTSLSRQTTFGSNSQGVTSTAGLLGGGSSADSRTNSGSTTITTVTKPSPFSTFGSLGSQQNVAHSTLSSSSTGPTVFGTTHQPVSGGVGLFGLGGANAGGHSIAAPLTASPSAPALPSVLPSLFGKPSSFSTSSSTDGSSLLQRMSAPSSSSSLLQGNASSQGPSAVPLPTASSPFTFGATPSNTSPFGTGTAVITPLSSATLFGAAPSQAPATGAPVDSSSQLGASPFSFGATSAATNQDTATSSSSGCLTGTPASGNHNPFAANAGSLSGGAQRRPKIRLKRTLH